MLGHNQQDRNEKPRSEGETQLQGMERKKNDTASNYTAAADLKARLRIASSKIYLK